MHLASMLLGIVLQCLFFLVFVYLFFCFFSEQEIITDMKEMVKEMMRQFRRRNHGKRPEQILFYRDGVSEGQFQTVSQQSV